MRRVEGDDHHVKPMQGGYIRRVLSKKAKYALNALVELARARKEGTLSAAAIARRARVPPKFLETILLELNRAGIVRTIRGRNGGHDLRRAPEEISMAEVLRLMDGAIGLVPCVTHHYYERCEECVDEATCGIRDVFAEIRLASVELLKASTLADVLGREKRLSRARNRRSRLKSH